MLNNEIADYLMKISYLTLLPYLKYGCPCKSEKIKNELGLWYQNIWHYLRIIDWCTLEMIAQMYKTRINNGKTIRIWAYTWQFCFHSKMIKSTTFELKKWKFQSPFFPKCKCRKFTLVHFHPHYRYSLDRK